MDFRMIGTSGVHFTHPSFAGCLCATQCIKLGQLIAKPGGQCHKVLV
uniref:Uncharacterized protein n=1 Tax=Anguilla anguilla TaxID=7936 RepID=A0A0E9QM12_ANGAN